MTAYACDHEKSFSFVTIVKIMGHVGLRFAIRVQTYLRSRVLYFKGVDFNIIYNNLDAMVRAGIRWKKVDSNIGPRKYSNIRILTSTRHHAL